MTDANDPSFEIAGRKVGGDAPVFVVAELSLAQEKLRAEQARLDWRDLGYTEEPLASCDFVHDSRSAIVDASQTRVAGARLAKVLIWFDNEWGYAHRMLDVAGYFLAMRSVGENTGTM